MVDFGGFVEIFPATDPQSDLERAARKLRAEAKA
jgi:hypothetical protein